MRTGCPSLSHRSLVGQGEGFDFLTRSLRRLDRAKSKGSSRRQPVCSRPHFFLFDVSSGTSGRKCRTVAETLSSFPARSIVSLFSSPGLPPSIDHTCPIVDPGTER